MQKKEKEPPAEKPRGAEKPDKDTERLERERLKKITTSFPITRLCSGRTGAENAGAEDF
jgi:hypothetical protein